MTSTVQVSGGEIIFQVVVSKQTYSFSKIVAYMLVEKLKRNLFPTLAVIIVPVGYFVGVTLRESRDEQALRQSIVNQRETLERQKAALEEERNVLQEKRRMLEEARRYKERRDDA